MSAKVFCLFGIHKMRKMPWMQTRDGSPKPDRACLRCGRIKYDWSLYVPSIEGPRSNYMNPQYEGQRPPEGYASWAEYRVRMRKARDALISLEFRKRYENLRKD